MEPTKQPITTVVLHDNTVDFKDWAKQRRIKPNKQGKYMDSFGEIYISVRDIKGLIGLRFNEIEVIEPFSNNKLYNEAYIRRIK